MIPPQIPMVREERRKSACFFDCLTHFTRVFGVFTAIVLCGVGVDLTVHKRMTGVYLLVCSAFVFWLEIIWAVTLFLQLCVRTDRLNFWKCWDVMTWLTGWKKTIIYLSLSTVPLVWPCRLWLCYVAGGQLIALAIFHLILQFKGKRRRRRKDHLLRVSDADSFDSSVRFEEVTEVLDDGLLPEPIPGSSHSLSDSLLDQDNMIEI